MKKTTGEAAFEDFCQANGLAVEPIEEGVEPTPDYLVWVDGLRIYVEVKQIDEDENFSSTRQFRTPGTHVRAKINQARNQLRSASQQGFPTVLLVFNNLDPVQRFGTEQHDFLAAMYGELTVHISRTRGTNAALVHDRNQSFREGKNESFSAVGWLYKGRDAIAVHLYENIYSHVALDFAALPPCIEFNRVGIEYA